LTGTLGLEFTFPFSIGGQPYVRTFEDLFLTAGDVTNPSSWDSAEILTGIPNVYNQSGILRTPKNALDNLFSITIESTKNSVALNPYEEVSLEFGFRRKRLDKAREIATEFYTAEDENIKCTPIQRP
jgi:hypothetical protein